MLAIPPSHGVGCIFQFLRIIMPQLESVAPSRRLASLTRKCLLHQKSEFVAVGECNRSPVKIFGQAAIKSDIGLQAFLACSMRNPERSLSSFSASIVVRVAALLVILFSNVCFAVFSITHERDTRLAASPEVSRSCCSMFERAVALLDLRMQLSPENKPLI